MRSVREWRSATREPSEKEGDATEKGTEDMAEVLAEVQALSTAVAALEGELASADARIEALEGELVEVRSLAPYLSVDTSTHAVVLSGANLYVQSGSGTTDADVNGLGNLVLEEWLKSS